MTYADVIKALVAIAADHVWCFDVSAWHYAHGEPATRLSAPKWTVWISGAGNFSAASGEELVRLVREWVESRRPATQPPVSVPPEIEAIGDPTLPH